MDCPDLEDRVSFQIPLGVVNERDAHGCWIVVEAGICGAAPPPVTVGDSSEFRADVASGLGQAPDHRAGSMAGDTGRLLDPPRVPLLDIADALDFTGSTSARKVTSDSSLIG